VAGAHADAKRAETRDRWSHSLELELIDEGKKAFLGSIAGLRDNQFAKL